MKKYKNAMNELIQIIDLLSEEDKNKIPITILEYFRKNQSTISEVTITADKPLSNQNISNDTKVLLAFVSTYL